MSAVFVRAYRPIQGLDEGLYYIADIDRLDHTMLLVSLDGLPWARPMTHECFTNLMSEGVIDISLDPGTYLVQKVCLQCPKRW